VAIEDLHGPSGQLFQGGKRIDGVTAWVITVHEDNLRDWGGRFQLPQTQPALALGPATIQFTDDHGRPVHGRVTVAACEAAPGDLWQVQITGLDPLILPQ
jgi:hypothetical protein